VKEGDRAWHECPERGGERPDAQAARRPRAEIVEVLTGGLELREHRVGAPDNDSAGIGETHATSVTLEERAAGCLFHQRNLARDRGLRIPQPLGRRRIARLRPACLSMRATENKNLLEDIFDELARGNTRAMCDTALVDRVLDPPAAAR
jgi:hypothetical protein